RRRRTSRQRLHFERDRLAVDCDLATLTQHTKGIAKERVRKWVVAIKGIKWHAPHSGAATRRKNHCLSFKGPELEIPGSGCGNGALVAVDDVTTAADRLKIPIFLAQFLDRESLPANIRRFSAQDSRS